MDLRAVRRAGAGEGDRRGKPEGEFSKRAVWKDMPLCDECVRIEEEDRLPDRIVADLAGER